jgi:hypothetical protein
MIKACEQISCCNFFKVGRKKRFCCQQCADADGKRQWRIRNREKVREAENARRRRKYQDDAEYRNKCIERRAATYSAMTSEQRRAVPRKKMGADYHRNYMAERASIDMDFRLRGSLRARVRSAIHANCGRKAVRTMELIGCSIKHLRLHLEQQFTSGMSWDNYGDWHIDHIKPCAAFDLADPAQQRECFHYTNLQPLWASDNLSKGARYEQTHANV